MLDFISRAYDVTKSDWQEVNRQNRLLIYLGLGSFFIVWIIEFLHISYYLRVGDIDIFQKKYAIFIGCILLIYAIWDEYKDKIRDNKSRIREFRENYDLAKHGQDFLILDVRNVIEIGDKRTLSQGGRVYLMDLRKNKEGYYWILNGQTIKDLGLYWLEKTITYEEFKSQYPSFKYLGEIKTRGEAGT